ncbi:hypothetical protein [Paenibacillus tyrfis]|uniref:hypothetical protein n=1 Tax=Paenibacillus tyrfis TaxID=1501230 RepID=UPI000B598250|nr:hypothetical protein [Paenibacillus tyrfis]
MESINFLHDAINELTEHKEYYQHYKQVRFSISLDYLDNKRSEYVAEHLGLSKQDLITKLYESALSELEASMGLFDKKSNKFSPEYKQWLAEQVNAPTEQ